ncbi:MAG: NPCBM/NEW2 domain-containing protein [bacterium]|nr:NPCBM/NEW2 domain-containing protein [bacterium]
MNWKIFALFFLGFLIRLLLIPQAGFEADVAFWKAWALAASEKGIVWMTYNTNYNYPAGFALVLWLIGKVYQIFADPNNFNQFWQVNNYLFLFLAKMPAIISDMFVAGGIYYLVSRPKIFGLKEEVAKMAPYLTAAYLFHPAILFDGAWWGQVDSLGIAFILFPIIFLALKKPIPASMLLIAGFLLKLQTIIFLPLFFLYVWRAFSWKEMIKSLTAGILVFAVITLPFSLGNSLGKTFYLIVQNSDWFPLLSLRAYNLWWLTSLGHGMEISDKILAVGIMPAKTVGLVIFSAIYFLTAMLVFLKPTWKNLLFALTIAALAFFLFPTQSHERYSLPALVFFIILLPYFWQNEIEKKISLTIFSAFSLFALLDLNTSMVVNYPNNGLPLIPAFAEPIWGILISIGNLLIFLFVLYFLILKHLPKYVWAISAGVIVLGLSGPNLGYLTKKEVSLTKLKPINYQQDYGNPQINMSVDSSFGPKKWTFLSVDYYFYRSGIGTHANSKISYDLAGKFKEFSTEYGIDTEGSENAGVIFEIYGDGRNLFTSQKIGRFDLPQSTKISIQGVKTLTLVVKDSGNGINGDHADWLNPTLFK